MSRLILDVSRCKGCSFCVISCPAKALESVDTLNAGGYRIVALNQSKCIGCGVCYTVCPDNVFEFVENEEGA